MDVGAGLAVWSVPLLCALAIIALDWRRNHPDAHPVDLVRADRFTRWPLLVTVGIWLLPLGWTLALPGLFLGCGLLALRNVDERAEWRIRWKPRALLSIGVVIGVLLTGFVGVSTPVGAAAWGPAQRTENPDAPAWTASSQHLWVELDGTVLVVNHVRMPGVLNPMGAGTMALWTLEVTGMDELRLKQAIEELPGPSTQADYFSLETQSNGQTHDYGGTELPYTIKHVKVDLFGERTGAHMVTVAKGEWGGEVRLLTVIKPVVPGTEAPFSHDPWASAEVIAWLEGSG